MEYLINTSMAWKKHIGAGSEHFGYCLYEQYWDRTKMFGEYVSTMITDFHERQIL